MIHTPSTRVAQAMKLYCWLQSLARNICRTKNSPSLINSIRGRMVVAAVVVGAEDAVVDVVDAAVEPI